MMEVRYASEPAPGTANNEDHALHAGPLVAVFDGVSAPEGLPTGCVHTTSWYVNRLAARLTGAATAAPDADLRSQLAEAIRAVRDDHAGSCDLDHPGTPAASVCAVRDRGQTLEYLILSDCTLVLDHAGRVEVRTDPRFTAAVAEIRATMLTGADDFGSAEHAARVREATELRQRRINRPGGYWIAAADPDAAAHALTGQLPLRGPERIRRAALLTDGAADAVTRYRLLDWPGLLDLLTTGGPQELIGQVRQAEQADAHGHDRPRYKRHDDATAALCLFDTEEPR
jgi:hypothetical protein